MHNKFITPIWIVVISALTQGLSEKTSRSAELACGNGDKLLQRCFDINDNATKIFLENQRKGMPLTSEEIDGNCKIFNVGLECYEDYLDKCMNAVDKRVISGETEPAKSLYHMLCKDSKFKENFLAHSECLRHIEKDWDKCTRNYQQIIESEFKRPEFEEKSNINLQHLHLCCARNSYKKCIHNSAMAKCNIRSAKFARDIVDLLSNERHLKNCAEIERTTLCSGGSYLCHDLIITLAIITLMMMVRKLAPL